MNREEQLENSLKLAEAKAELFKASTEAFKRKQEAEKFLAAELALALQHLNPERAIDITVAGREHASACDQWVKCELDLRAVAQTELESVAAIHRAQLADIRRRVIQQ